MNYVTDKIAENGDRIIKNSFEILLRSYRINPIFIKNLELAIKSVNPNKLLKMDAILGKTKEKTKGEKRMTNLNRGDDAITCAYKEIYEIMKLLPKELIDRIPKEKQDFFYNNMNKNYLFNITQETFNANNILEETKAILTILFRDYWATPEQREKIFEFENEAKKRIEEKAQIKYNPNNLFKKENNYNKESLKVSNEKVEGRKVLETKSMIEYKENILKRFMNKIINIFGWRKHDRRN